MPVRVPVATFAPNRTQRRILRTHGALAVTRRELGYDAEHYALYLRYQRHRHPGGGMDQDSREQYQHFLLHSNVATDLVEFREGGVLRMVSLVDRLADGLSSVYTFFEPDVRATSYGTFNILWQIRRCQELGLPYLYLGYWIAESAKMAYKATFRPIEGLVSPEVCRDAQQWPQWSVGGERDRVRSAREEGHAGKRGQPGGVDAAPEPQLDGARRLLPQAIHRVDCDQPPLADDGHPVHQPLHLVQVV